MQKLDEIEKSLDGAKDLMLAQLTRRFIKEINCKDTKKDDAHLFLFNDLLLWARPRSKKNRFEVKRHAPLLQLTCSDGLDAKCLEIVWPDGTRDHFELASTEERNAWRTELSTHITSCKEEAKKKPAALATPAATTGDRASGRGKLTRTTSDNHIKAQAVAKSSSVSEKETSQISSPKELNVPMLTVGAPVMLPTDNTAKPADGVRY